MRKFYLVFPKKLSFIAQALCILSLISCGLSAEEDQMARVREVKSLIQQGDFEAARLVGKEMREKYPKYAYGYYIVGLMEMSQKKLERGDENLLKAIKLGGLNAKDQGSAYYNLGISARRQGKLSDAIGHLENAVVANPEDAIAAKTLTLLKSQALGHKR